LSRLKGGLVLKNSRFYSSGKFSAKMGSDAFSLSLGERAIWEKGKKKGGFGKNCPEEGPAESGHRPRLGMILIEPGRFHPVILQEG